MRDSFEQLRRIQDAITKIAEYARKGRPRFDKEEEVRLSVVHYLQIIGEAASTIPQDFRDRHPEIPWRPMISMRNKLIHHYDGIDLDIVWETATLSIPDRKPKIDAILNTER